jgi:aminodeoxyfutalosine synthase
MYASFLRISRALHLDVFEQPGKTAFQNSVSDTCMDSDLLRIKKKLAAGERLDARDGLTLFSTDDLFGLGRLANGVKKRLHGNKVYFGVSLNINYTNVCTLRCPICAFSRDEGAADAYSLSQEEIVKRAAAAHARGVSEVHIVGGLHRDINLTYFTEMFTRLRQIDPLLNINALTATECDYLSRKEGVPLPELFARLKASGLGSMPGGGAEILDDTIRGVITPLKIGSYRWLEVSREAHQAGIMTNATMLWGHVESYEDRVKHMLRLRTLQDETAGFKAFVPLLFHPGNTRLSHLKKVSSAAEMLKVYAVSRLMLDNVAHIKALWMYLGLKFAGVVLRFGADDMGGTSFDERIVHAAGSTSSVASKETLVHQIRSMGLISCEVDSNYRVTEKDA